LAVGAHARVSVNRHIALPFRTYNMHNIKPHFIWINESSPLFRVERTHSEPLTTSEFDPSQTSAVQSDCNRERSTRYFTQLRPQGRNSRQGEVLRPASRSLSRPSPTWRHWWNRCSSSGGRYANRSSSYTAACWPSCETTRCAGTWRVSARNAFYVWAAVAATECPWRLLPRCRNGTSTNAKAVKAADERMSRVRLS
jgi:hypothetical protein